MIGDAADRAIDAATPGKVGHTRKGFHTSYTPVRYVTVNGTPGRHNLPARCTCTQRYNHIKES